MTLFRLRTGFEVPTMRLAFFEDRFVGDFGPIVLTRPVFELICGHFSLRERLMRVLPLQEWGGFVRGHLAETFRELHPEARINDFRWLGNGPTLIVNGRWIPNSSQFLSSELFPHDAAGFVGDTPVWIVLNPEEIPLLGHGDWEQAMNSLARLRRAVPGGGILATRPWELIDRNPAQLAEDFAIRDRDDDAFPDGVAILGDPDNVSISRTARIDPYVVIDCDAGPVSIDAGAVIQPFTRLEGPCHIGQGTRLFRAHIRGGTTVGPVCRVGGEVEATIFQGYANKYHDGFLGHSFVGEWVNLGAQTSNSDLKLDYSHVRVPLDGSQTDTGMTKVGCLLADHVKTGIGCLINTGTSVGVMCVVLPAGGLLPRHIPSFTSVMDGKLTEKLALDRLLQAAAVAMNRRDRELSSAQQRLLRYLHQTTRREREDAQQHQSQPIAARH